MMHLFEQIILVSLTFALSFGLCALLIRAPGFLPDVPNHRSLHRDPTPRGGGLAFGISFLTSLGVVLFYFYPQFINESLIAFFVGSILVYLLGLMDDAYALPALLRLSLQILIALVLCSYGAPEKIHFLGFLEFYGWPALLLQVFWVLTCINLFNFMDGLDGLAGTQAFLWSLIFAFLLWVDPIHFNMPEVIELTDNLQDPAIYGILSFTYLSLGAAILGFLYWNMPPARLFMGDGGSYLLGFIFGFIGIILPYDPARTYPANVEITVLWTSPLWVDHLMVFIVWLPFLLDPAFTIIRRLFSGENILRAHREHLFQLFFRNGWPVSRILGFFLFVDLVFAVPFLLKIQGMQYLRLLVLLLALTLLFLVLYILSYRRYIKTVRF